MIGTNPATPGNPASRKPALSLPEAGEPPVPFSGVLAALSEPSSLGLLVEGQDGNRQSQLSAAADVFNEHGFFQPPLAAGSRASAQTETSAKATEPQSNALPRMVLAPTPSDMPETASIACFPIAAHVAGVSVAGETAVRKIAGDARPGAGPDTAPLISSERPRPRHSGGPAILPYASLMVDQPEAGEGAGAPSTVRSRSSEPMHAAEAVPVEAQLLVQTSGQGVEILARIDKFSLTERVSLRDRMVAMLSRHGFVAHDIRINGVSSGARPKTEEGS